MNDAPRLVPFAGAPSAGASSAGHEGDASAGGEAVTFVPIAGVPGVECLPFSLRVLLENLLRQAAVDGRDTAREVQDLLERRAGAAISFAPSRVFGQDILGLVMLVDLAALRDALAEAGLDPELASPKVPVDIIVDHSLQVDAFARPDAMRINLELEYRRNAERFAFLRWCASSLPGVRVVPPGKGIMHQLHLEEIGEVVRIDETARGRVASPDTCVGTDSHTPMINALGVLGWGVGGIEAEVVMLGKPVSMALPEVVGVEIGGQLREGVTPTDMVLFITEALRRRGVVGKFVEFFGRGLDALPVGDRGTIANMAPEYGATAVYFPIDACTIEYLRTTGRPEARVRLVEAYARAQALWRDRTTPAPAYDAIVSLDLSAIRPCIAGPKNPQDRVDLEDAPASFAAHAEEIGGRAISPSTYAVAGADYGLRDGHVVIAAITSCTNTSNPTGMITAGLVARNAVARGLRSRPWVKTSLAPGSHVVSTVLERAGLLPALEALGFHVVGYGCTTCNGGSGPLPGPIAEAIEGHDVLATAVLSGNRNFQGRIHPNVRAAYLASPALVLAYAIAGSLTADVAREALGVDENGEPVHLRDIWPSSSEVARIVEQVYDARVFREKYADLLRGGGAWDRLALTQSALFAWQDASTYIRRPPYFDGLTRDVPPVRDIVGARPLVILGDRITTDDISPSGAISLGTPAADFLLAHGVAQPDFNNYTTRRGDHEVAVRATFANVRLRNRMAPGTEGGVTRLMPDGTVMRIFEAAEIYRQRGVPLVVVAGRAYGSGSSRDWAAKGVALLGVKAVIAASFERIHRSNLVGMGVLPLELADGASAASLALDGTETFDVVGLDRDLAVGARIEAILRRADGRTERVPLVARIETSDELDTWRNGGILPKVWREAIAAQKPSDAARAT